MNNTEYAHFKRALDFYRVDPDFRQDIQEDPSGAVKSLGLSFEDPELVRQGITAISVKCGPDEETNPYAIEFNRRNSTVSAYVAHIHRREAFSCNEFFRFADTVRNRCRMESQLIRLHGNIRYFPLCFELSIGCTVQCPFCGLNASHWRENFLYTPDNAALWRAVLESAVDLLGPIAGSSPCYLATEPLDNPDYERFLADFFRITGQVPQTTTAVADRDIERLRSLMRWIGEDRLREQASLRLSIRTKNQFFRIAEAFYPEELADVELLPNNPESSSRYADAGRARNCHTGKKANYPYSICCVAGVRVNMAEHSLHFLEPEIPNDDFPLGIRMREKLLFTDAMDFRKKLAYLMEKWAVGLLPVDRPLMLNQNCTVKQEEHAILFLGDRIGYRIVSNDFTRQTLQLLNGGRSLKQIQSALQLSAAWEDDYYSLMNQLFIRGYLRLRT